MDKVAEKRTQAGLTRTLAERAIALRYDELPSPVRELAGQCVLDYLGVALAGAEDALVRILLDEMEEAGGVPQASVIGHEARLPALSAALVNGAIKGSPEGSSKCEMLESGLGSSPRTEASYRPVTLPSRRLYSRRNSEMSRRPASLRLKA